MLSYGAYMGILLPILTVIPLIFGVALIFISKERLTEIIKMVLGIEKTLEADSGRILIDFHGTKMDLKESADRQKLIIILLLIFTIINTLFINGCVVSIEHLTPGQACPDKPRNCFIFQSRTSVTPSKSFECNPGEIAISVNSSTFRAVCYRYILDDQKAVDILNQLGICAGVISLSANILWFLCWMASHRWGWFILCLIFTVIGSLTTVFIFLRGRFEVVAYVLHILWTALVAMTAWIVLVNKDKRESIQTELDAYHGLSSTDNQNLNC